MSTDKRRYKRVHPDEAAPVEVHVMGTGFLDVLHARNISEGGVKIDVPHLFDGCDINADVEFIIKIPKYKSFKVVGNIKHIHKDGISFGVQFSQIESKCVTLIGVYVSQRLLAGAEA